MTDIDGDFNNVDDLDDDDFNSDFEIEYELDEDNEFIDDNIVDFDKDDLEEDSNGIIEYLDDEID